MEDTKNQHFLPRFLLKQFSPDTKKRSINMYLLDQDRFIYNACLYNQACQDYLYGEDQVLEKKFQELEEKAAPLIKKICIDGFSLLDEEKAWIKAFVYFQNQRTPEAHSKLIEIFKKLKLEIPEKYKEKYSRLHPFPNDFFFLFNMAVDTVYTIEDLRLIVITAPKDKYFIIGEHPVIILNPFLYERDWPCSKDSISAKGAIVCLPISEKKMLILYDHIMYRMKKINHKVIISSEDIDLLNYCQFLYTNNLIFTKYINEKYLGQMNNNSKDFRKSSKVISEIYPIESTFKNRKQKFLVMHSEELPIMQKLSFIQETEFAFYHQLGPTMDVKREAIKHYEQMHPRKEVRELILE